MTDLGWLPYCNCQHAATTYSPACEALVPHHDFGYLTCACPGFALTDDDRRYAEQRGEAEALGRWLVERGLSTAG